MHFKQALFGAVLAASCMFVVPNAALATTFIEEDFVCPIGGEKFTADVVASNSSFGQRPDGKPYSPLPVIPLTECPKNGFLIFKEEWAEEELDILSKAIRSDEFQRIREEETTYYRLWWLQEKIATDPATLVSNLMVAAWQTDFATTRKSKYQMAFVKAVATLSKNDEPEDWFWFNLRAANAERELGLFAKATERFAAIEAEMAIITDERTQNYVQEFIDGQRTLIAEKNTAYEPANLVGEENAFFRCAAFIDELTASEKPICNSEAMQENIATFSIEGPNGDRLKGKPAIDFVLNRLAEMESGQ